MNSNTINILVGLAIPSLILEHLTADSFAVPKRGVSRLWGALIMAAYLVFAATLIMTSRHSVPHLRDLRIISLPYANSAQAS